MRREVRPPVEYHKTLSLALAYDKQLNEHRQPTYQTHKSVTLCISLRPRSPRAKLLKLIYGNVKESLMREAQRYGLREIKNARAIFDFSRWSYLSVSSLFISIFFRRYLRCYLIEGSCVLFPLLSIKLLSRNFFFFSFSLLRYC